MGCGCRKATQASIPGGNTLPPTSGTGQFKVTCTGVGQARYATIEDARAAAAQGSGCIISVG